MKVNCASFRLVCCALFFIFCFSGTAGAETIFQGRQIFLSNDDNTVFRIGVTGTTAGYNFIALAKDAEQESIPLGDFGYWEKVSDPPSFLRNDDLQLTVKNRTGANFQIEFQYDKKAKTIRYRVIEGPVRVKADASAYYPVLLVEGGGEPVKASPAAAPVAVKKPEKRPLKRFLFFDFNSFDADLRRYYGKVKQMLNNPDYEAYFYYYESANYDGYFFRTYRNTAKLDTEKMGLSLEDGTLGYYQKVLEHLKSRHGKDFTDQIILVTRFGKPFAKALKNYANDIGISSDMVVTIWSYEDVK